MWTTYLAALLTPVIAVFGAMIGYRQWRTAQNKLKLDLFERRYAIYDALRGYLSVIMTTGKTDIVSEQKFLQGTHGAKWLLNDDIEHYLHIVIWHKACDLGCLQSELEGHGVGEERTIRVHKAADIKKWFGDQYEVVDKKFEKFLKLRH